MVSCLPAVVCEGWVFRGQPLSLGRNQFTEGNSERLREQAKETKAVVDLKKPSLPSFSSVEFLVRLLSLRRNQFTEGNPTYADPAFAAASAE